MRRTVTALLTALVLALPVTDAVAASRPPAKPKPKKKVVTTTRTFRGPAASVSRWGELQVTIVVRKTTTTVGARKTVARRITAVNVPVYPNHTDRSVYINSQALPYLKQEALQAQSANVQMISGATDTSYGFAESLQAAITLARKF